MDSFSSALAAFSFTAVILLVPAFAWHIKSRNIPAISLIFWLTFENLVGAINACIWSGDDFNQTFDGNVYCDITIKLEAGASSGKLACIAALAMNLYMVLSADNAGFLDANSNKKTIVNVLMCWTTPIFVMATNYIIQTSRYSIARYKGCVSAYDYSVATVMLYLVWMVVWATVATIFAALTIFRYFQKKKDVLDILKCTNSGLTLRRFARLLVFCLLVILCLFPVALLYFITDVQTVYYGSFNYARVHSTGWSIITYWDFGKSFMYGSWINIALAIVTFLLFGVGSDALKMYKRVLFRLGCKKFADTTTNHQFSKTLSGLSNQTRVASNTSHKSEFTQKTDLSAATYGYGLGLGDVIESPYTEKASYDTHMIDLEKVSSEEDVLPEGSFGYNLEVIQR